MGTVPLLFQAQSSFKAINNAAILRKTQSQFS
jgi:hypothetical protein